MAQEFDQPARQWKRPRSDPAADSEAAAAERRAQRRAERAAQAMHAAPQAAQTPSAQAESPRSQPPQPPPVRPIAGPARLRPRHRGLMLSVVAVVVLPLLATVLYLYLVAQDQYASTMGITIRQEETGSASELMGGLSQFLGTGVQGQADLLYEFVQSQQIVERIADTIDLGSHYSATWPADPLFSLWPGAQIEDLVWFWGRMVRVSFDRSTGLLQLQVRARDPVTAQAIARAIVAESERMINQLNETARRDATRNAEADLEAALDRLRDARQAVAAFRARTQIVDPQSDIQGRMGVLNNLQEQLAVALVDHDLLLMTAEEGDPRLRQSQRRIDVVRNRIREERRSITEQDVTVDDTDFPTLIAEYESLMVTQNFAEQTYQAALTALDAARSNAARQSLYLANFIEPTLAQRAQYPQRLLLSALAAFFLTLLWSVLALIYYSLRDRG